LQILACRATGRGVHGVSRYTDQWCGRPSARQSLRWIRACTQHQHVFNAALSFRLNWEGNFRTFEAEAEAVLDHGQILGTSVEKVLETLRADPETVHQFEEAYGHPPDRASLLDAIAAYEQSLLTPGSRFDRWLGGDAAALSAEELKGYQMFKSLGCISCHQGVNVGGNLFERHGIFHPLASPKPEILRVPSLRNVATTPPYFHDGSAPTLQEAVHQMGLPSSIRRSPTSKSTRSLHS
jgi:cytochrome c peroxidase